MEGAVYSLTIVLIGNILTYWGRYFYHQYRVVRILKEEILIVCKRIENNRTTVEGQMDNEGFPLLGYIEMPMHNSLASEYILNQEISVHATKIIGNTKHYNRIIELGDRGRYLQRKNELIQQGALIHNIPAFLNVDRGGERKPLVGYTEEYLNVLNKEIERYKKIIRYFPWYLFIMASPASVFLQRPTSQPTQL